MRIVIDMQGAQGLSKNRGMGRYSLSFAKALARNQGNHEVVLALSGLFPETIDEIRAEFDRLLPQCNIRVWSAVPPVEFGTSENSWRRKTAELMREAFLASLKPDFVHVSSLFEGLVDNVVTSVGLFQKNIPTTVTLYDLIPLIYKYNYLANPIAEKWYECKLGHLYRADFLLAISDSSRREAIDYLGFPPDNIVSVYSAIEGHFKPRKPEPLEEKEIRRRYGLTQPFVMYTGGIDFRKNIEGLIRAYSQLPSSIRSSHQLAVVCSVQPQEEERLRGLAKQEGLNKKELVLTGFVPEEDLVALYNLSKAFVFPSLHEGFGLPVLEAMACGRAVIASNTSSLQEIVGRADALFDPFNEDDLTAKLAHMLIEDAFREDLEKHGLEQARQFSWDSTAQKAWSAFEAWHKQNTLKTSTFTLPSQRPKLAYISPLPPERSGISDYSAQLLPELSRHYDIDVVVNQESVCDTWTKANCSILDVESFKARADRYERVLYHFGNSPFHRHMFDLLEEIPGVVVLHDFFLSGIIAHMDNENINPGFWSRELYHSHGYSAVMNRFHLPKMADTVWKYPCSLRVLQEALGIIVHSEHSRKLIRQWYGERGADHCSVLPLLRRPAMKRDRSQARRALGLGDGQFVVCSFGEIGQTKVNHRLLSAWLESKLPKHESVLVFVGHSDEGEYGAVLERAIKKSGVKHRIRITGWADAATFQHYLMAADVAVQLRTMSRGETSAAVLDCMNYGLPTIVNAHGSLAELPEDGVWKLSDEFEDAELIHALETLWEDKARRMKLGSTAREIILSRHNPRSCAELYAKTIEGFYHQQKQTGQHGLINAIGDLEDQPEGIPEVIRLSENLARNFPAQPVPKQLLVDVSTLVQHDAKTGIQRVTRSILNQLLKKPPEGYRVEPIYASVEHGYRYARAFTLKFIDCPELPLEDDVIDYHQGDVFFGLDLAAHVAPKYTEFYQDLRKHGVPVQFMVHDLLPITLSHTVARDMLVHFLPWLHAVVKCDGAVCVSQATARELKSWIEQNETIANPRFKINWSHNGGDIGASSPTQGIPEEGPAILDKLKSNPSFLMVGTIEPRKRHAQVLAAFERLLAKGNDLNLVIVGKQGWMVESLVEQLRHHPEKGKRLFWLEGISDEYLENIYASCTCLIFASEGEGFGLPLIEAAQHKLPIIARDIPVFREVAGGHAFYFSGKEPEALATSIQNWVSLYKSEDHPKSDDMPWLTWEQSAEKLKSILFHGNPHARMID